MGLIQDLQGRKLTGCRGCDAVRQRLYKSIDWWAATTHDSFDASTLGAFNESILKARGSGVIPDPPYENDLILVKSLSAPQGPTHDPRILLLGDRSSDGIDQIKLTYDTAATEILNETSTTYVSGGGSWSDACSGFTSLNAYTWFEFDDNTTFEKPTRVDILVSGTATSFANLQFWCAASFNRYFTLPALPMAAAAMNSTFSRFDIYMHNQHHGGGQIGVDWTDTKIFYSDSTDETVAKSALTSQTGTPINLGCLMPVTGAGRTRYRMSSVANPTKTVTKAQLLDTSAAVLLELPMTFNCNNVSAGDVYVAA